MSFEVLQRINKTSIKLQASWRPGGQNLCIPGDNKSGKCGRCVNLIAICFSSFCQYKDKCNDDCPLSCCTLSSGRSLPHQKCLVPS